VGARSRHVYIMATGLGEDMNLGSYRWHAASRTLRAGDFQILDVRLQIGLIFSNMWWHPNVAGTRKKGRKKEDGQNIIIYGLPLSLGGQ